MNDLDPNLDITEMTDEERSEYLTSLVAQDKRKAQEAKDEEFERRLRERGRLSFPGKDEEFEGLWPKIREKLLIHDTLDRDAEVKSQKRLPSIYRNF